MKNLMLFLISLFIIVSCNNNDKRITQNSKPNEDTIAIIKKENKFKVKYENPTDLLGIGLAKFQFLNDSIEIFNDNSLENDYKKFHYLNVNEVFYPKFYEYDYGIYFFIVIDSSEKSYEVIINQRETKFVSKSDSFIFESWEEHLKNSFGVRRKDKNQNFYLKSTQLSDTMKIENKLHENLCVMEVKGNWLRVKIDCKYGTNEYINYEQTPCNIYIDECSQSEDLWLQWNNGNSLLLDIFLDS